MRIISIDPGYERLGIAVIEKLPRAKETLLYSDCYKTSKDLVHHERLSLVGAEIERIIAEHKPETLALETLFFSKNQTTAIKVAEVRGVILYIAAKNNLSVFEYNPMSIKVAVTGHGGSDKAAVTSMIPRLIRIEKSIKHDDEYDAIAVGLTCFATERF